MASLLSFVPSKISNSPNRVLVQVKSYQIRLFSRSFGPKHAITRNKKAQSGITRLGFKENRFEPLNVAVGGAPAVELGCWTDGRFCRARVPPEQPAAPR